LIPYVKQMGYTHIELMPVMEYPFDGSWDTRLSIFAATSRYGTPQTSCTSSTGSTRPALEFSGLDARAFPSDGHGLAQFDGTHLYEHADPAGQHPDWALWSSTTAAMKCRIF